MLKIIYLSIYYSNIGLDYDNIYTILLLFFKNFLNFFPFGIVLLVYWFIFIFFYIIKVKELKSSCIKRQLAFSLRISHLFLLRNFKTLLKFLNLIVHWIFGLITLHLICFTYWGGFLFFSFFFVLNYRFVEFYYYF